MQAFSKCSNLHDDNVGSLLGEAVPILKIFFIYFDG